MGGREEGMCVMGGKREEKKKQKREKGNIYLKNPSFYWTFSRLFPETVMMNFVKSPESRSKYFAKDLYEHLVLLHVPSVDHMHW